MSEKNVAACAYGVIKMMDIPARIQHSKDHQLEDVMERFISKMESEKRPTEKMQYKNVVDFLVKAREKGGVLENIVSSNCPEVTVSFISKEVMKSFANEVKPEKFTIMVELPMPDILRVNQKDFREAEMWFSLRITVSNVYENKLQFRKAELLLRHARKVEAGLESMEIKQGKLILLLSFDEYEKVVNFEKTMNEAVSKANVKKG